VRNCQYSSVVYNIREVVPHHWKSTSIRYNAKLQHFDESNYLVEKDFDLPQIYSQVFVNDTVS
jgi:hypothetical protein